MNFKEKEGNKGVDHVARMEALLSEYKTIGRELKRTPPQSPMYDTLNEQLDDIESEFFRLVREGKG